jgi:hypothetical protein
MATAVVVSDAVATEEEAAAEPVAEDTSAEG